MEAFLDCEWDSLCKLFTVDESPDLFANNNTILHNVDHNNSYYSSLSEWISNPPNNFLETNSHANNSDSCADVSSSSNDILSCIDFSAVNGEIDGSLRLTDTTAFANDGNIIDSVNMSSPNTELSLKRKLETPKKNARVSKTTPKSNKKAKQKPELETTSNSEDSNPCISEEINEAEDSTSNITVSTTSTGKKRASRGAATDPQSLYARKRRMKINERLRILQNLVPNGTKVDISTMLEEAFHYVKFMQLQIRLLSSDELWMYAPLAYNGLDVGAYGRMPSFPGL